MELSLIIPHIEALIFASEKPLTTLDLVELVNNALGFMEERATLDQVESAVEAVCEKYQSEFYPFEVRESGGGWQFLTKGAFHKTVALLNGEKFLKRLSTAALETLAIIAYKQPVTKGEIENIRGVNCDYAVQKLLEKELVIITGRKEDAPGHPLVYATSKTFMDYFGINSPADLPRLTDLFSQETVLPTTISHSSPVEPDMPEAEETEAAQAAAHLVVDENGNIDEIKNLPSGDLAEENTPESHQAAPEGESGDADDETGKEDEPSREPEN